MSITVHSPTPQRNPFAAADAPTLALVLARLEQADPLRHHNLADLKSAVRTVAKVLGSAARGDPGASGLPAAASHRHRPGGTRPAPDRAGTMSAVS